MPFIKLQNTVINTDSILYATIIERQSAMSPYVLKSTSVFPTNFLVVKFKQAVDLQGSLLNMLNYDQFKVPDLELKYDSLFMAQKDLDTILKNIQ